MSPQDIARIIRDCAAHQIATTPEGHALAGPVLDQLITLISRNAGVAIGYELDAEFCGEEPTIPATVGAEAAIGIVVLERSAA